MKHCRMIPLPAWTVAGCLCLLVACTPAAVDDSGGNPEPAAGAASDTVTPGEQAGAQPQDIIDRMFSPLDKAVSDINRDLNKGEAGTDAPSDTKE